MTLGEFGAPKGRDNGGMAAAGGKMEAHGREIMRLTPAELARFTGEHGLNFNVMQAHFEEKYREYEFPDSAFIDHLVQDQEDLNRLAEGIEGDEMNLLYLDDTAEEPQFARREMRRDGGHWKEENKGVLSEEKRKNHIQPDDLVFMVKKNNQS